MEYISDYAYSKTEVYQVFRNSDGFLELYRSSSVKKEVDAKTGKDKVVKDNLNRIVTNIKELSEIATFLKEGVKRKAKRQKKYDPYQDEGQGTIF